MLITVMVWHPPNLTLELDSWLSNIAHWYPSPRLKQTEARIYIQRKPFLLRRVWDSSRLGGQKAVPQDEKTRQTLWQGEWGGRPPKIKSFANTENSENSVRKKIKIKSITLLSPRSQKRNQIRFINRDVKDCCKRSNRHALSVVWSSSKSQVKCPLESSWVQECMISVPGRQRQLEHKLEASLGQGDFSLH